MAGPLLVIFTLAFWVNRHVNTVRSIGGKESQRFMSEFSAAPSEDFLDLCTKDGGGTNLQKAQEKGNIFECVW